jgi:hypothetical protein
MSEVDDMEKSALLSRCREILHQGYKFGFEVSSVIVLQWIICVALYLLNIGDGYQIFPNVMIEG